MDHTRAFAQLQTCQDLSILRIAESIGEVTGTQTQDGTNTSNVKAIGLPGVLAADLAHYQELFSKLRFSYVEQVTKERFLRAIVADAPDFVSAAENSTLESQLKEDKQALQAKKQGVKEIVLALEEQGRQLAQRYERIRSQTGQLERLPTEIADLEQAIATLRQQQEPRSADPEMSMPLPSTLALLYERQDELTGIDLEIQRLQSAVPARRAEAHRLQDELAPLQMRKIAAVAAAQDARRRREHGGMADELEERGRWLRGVETSLKAVLEV